MPVGGMSAPPTPLVWGATAASPLIFNICMKPLREIICWHKYHHHQCHQYANNAQFYISTSGQPGGSALVPGSCEVWMGKNKFEPNPSKMVVLSFRTAWIWRVVLCTSVKNYKGSENWTWLYYNFVAEVPILKIYKMIYEDELGNYFIREVQYGGFVYLLLLSLWILSYLLSIFY